MEAMKEMSDNQFDLAIVDPPYGINIAKWDNDIPQPKYFKELFRVSKNQIIWGANYFIESLYSSNSFIVWDKEKSGEIFAHCEMAWTSFNTVAKIYKYRWNGMLQEDMKNKEERI